MLGYLVPQRVNHTATSDIIRFLLWFEMHQFLSGIL